MNGAMKEKVNKVDCDLTCSFISSMPTSMIEMNEITAAEVTITLKVTYFFDQREKQICHSLLIGSGRTKQNNLQQETSEHEHGVILND